MARLLLSFSGSMGYTTIPTEIWLDLQQLSLVVPPNCRTLTPLALPEILTGMRDPRISMFGWSLATVPASSVNTT